MEDYKKKTSYDNDRDKEIVFSQTVKAGKRIYYIDVKKNRKDDTYLSITESKKVVTGEGEDAQVNYEKHKIFIYSEDFDKFEQALKHAFNYIKGQAADEEPPAGRDCGKDDNASLSQDEIKLDIDF